MSYPLPGTKFYELVKAQLGAKTHWQDSNDLDMMFHGTYSSNFYLLIRDLLHDRISLEASIRPTRRGIQAGQACLGATLAGTGLQRKAIPQGVGSSWLTHVERALATRATGSSPIPPGA